MENVATRCEAGERENEGGCVHYRLTLRPLPFLVFLIAWYHLRAKTDNRRSPVISNASLRQIYY